MAKPESNMYEVQTIMTQWSIDIEGGLCNVQSCCSLTPHPPSACMISKPDTSVRLTTNFIQSCWLVTSLIYYFIFYLLVVMVSN